MISASVYESVVSASITFRPATPSDRDFLCALYRTTREVELALMPWGEDEVAAFVEQQFSAQDAYYRQVYPTGRFDVVEVRGWPVGRCYVARLPGELRLIDITLVPVERGHGIGSAILAGLCAEADAAGSSIRLHVEPWNPARRMYLRAGLRPIEMRGIYEFMERPPANSPVTADEPPQGD